MKAHHTATKSLLIVLIYGSYLQVSTMSVEPAPADQVASLQQAEEFIRETRSGSIALMEAANKAIEQGDPSEVKKTTAIGSNKEVNNDAEQRISLIEVAGNNAVVTNQRADQLSVIKVTGTNAQVTNVGSTQVSDIRIYGPNGHVMLQNAATFANITVIGSNPSAQAYSCKGHSRVLQMSHDREQNPYVLEVEEWVQDDVLRHTERMTNYGTRMIEESGFTRSLSDPNAKEEPLPRKATKLPDPDNV